MYNKVSFQILFTTISWSCGYRWAGKFLQLNSCCTLSSILFEFLQYHPFKRYRVCEIFVFRYFLNSARLLKTYRIVYENYLRYFLWWIQICWNFFEIYLAVFLTVPDHRATCLCAKRCRTGCGEDKAISCCVKLTLQYVRTVITVQQGYY